MKYLLPILLLILGCDTPEEPEPKPISCDGDSNPASTDVSCTDLETDLDTMGEAFSIAFMEAIFSGGSVDSTVCNAYVSSAQAFIDGECTLCGSNPEACLDDETNEDTCCDEIDQTGVDEISAICGG